MLLSPYRVLDLTSGDGTLCATILGDLGAEVIQVEPSDGAHGRRVGPFLNDHVDPEGSLSWWAYARCKRSVVLELDRDRETFFELVEGADFLIESEPVGSLDARGFGYAALVAGNPALIHVTITPFSSTGPKAGWASTDLTLVTAAGPLAITGDDDRSPVRISIPQAWHHAATEAAAGALIALHERLQRRTHRRARARRRFEMKSAKEKIAMRTDEMTRRAVRVTAVLVAMLVGAVVHADAAIDPTLEAFIATVKAVDNHTHVNSTAPDDADSDALPLDAIPPFTMPVRLRPDDPTWIDAYKSMYGYQYNDLAEPHLAELRTAIQRVHSEQGDRFPTWVLDRIGTEVMVANRVAMGPGLAPPRFQWASYVDALMLPLSSATERATNDDYAALYPLEEKLLHRYLDDLNIKTLPPTLDAYVATVVVPTLERQRKGGCIAVKFEAAYLRKLDFDDPDAAAARAVYAKYVGGGAPTHAEYKSLQDYLFREIARNAGRLGMAVHIHAVEGAGAHYKVAGSDPLLLEPALNDKSLYGTNFVVVHGGGVFASHTAALFWKPNLYADFSVLQQLYPASRLAGILRDWLATHPEKVLFGTDAFATGPDAGWEISAWRASRDGRRALGIALTEMMRDGEIPLARAEEIATMVLRANAAKLYALPIR